VKPSDLAILLGEGEGTMLEYKESLSSSFARELVALANTAGGKILLGVRDDGSVKGISDTNQLRGRIQDLAARSVLTHSGTSRLIDRLDRAGLVTRADAEEDGRGAYAVLTESGREHFLQAARQHTAFVKELFLSHFSRDELETMSSFWARLEDS